MYANKACADMYAELKSQMSKQIKEETEQKRLSKKSKSNMIGRIAYITNIESIFYGEWGVVKFFDGDAYHIAIANDDRIANVFDRNEFVIKRKIKK